MAIGQQAGLFDGSAQRGLRDRLSSELVVDNFAGAGGASLGIEQAIGRPIDLAINHDPEAIKTHVANHPGTRHFVEDVWEVDPLEVTAGEPVGLAWFSPDCKHFSKAKGGKPVSKRVRGLAWVVIKWANLVKPRVIILENVEEFQTWGPLGKDERPCPMRKGSTFRRWVRSLKRLGYAVEWCELKACDYGAPTTRKRLFLIARCDGEEIVWPMPTHGPGRGHAHRAAAECIDWSLPCPSIFLTREEGRSLGVNRPLAEKTMRRIALGLKRYVLENPKPFIINLTHGGRVESVDEPLRTITGARRGEKAIVMPWVAKHYGGVVGTSVENPLGTVTARGTQQTLAVAHLLKNNFGSKPCTGVDEPLHTVTSGGHHALVSSFLTKFYGTGVGSGVGDPVPTVTVSGGHIGEVRAFLVKYFGTGGGQAVDESLHTVTSRDRFGLVMIEGEEYQIADIGLRMLTPRELARAQGFPDDYTLLGTKTRQVAQVGNSVCPVMAKVLVEANL